ncbi:deleted in malignant brain tumors 1 protein-like isoform X2 [Asterias rubens]|nr:deleted in malignant brain tumors 1 protein-like isoform X2 [Asterias rubens]
MLRGEWGTICSEDFEIEEARVACRQLGYGYVEAIREFGEGTKKVVEMMNCNGNEDKLSECYYDFQYVRCQGYSDVGVVCTNTTVPVTTPAPDIDSNIFRLVGGATPYEGRVEVFSPRRIGYWASMCSAEEWNFEKAELVCKGLGYLPATMTTLIEYNETIAGPIAGCWISGSLEYALCVPVDEFDFLAGCNRTINVVCSGTEPGVEGEIRIVNGSTVAEGRVESFNQNTWKSLCADDWGIEEVQATCRQLGLPEPSSDTVLPGGTFGGNEETLQNSVTCTGRENCLQTCTWIPNPSCLVQNAAARCGSVQEADMSDLRLVNGGSSAQGRVEMMFKGEWGVLCMDEFHLEEATVVCHQLGFIFAESVGSLYAEGTVTKKFILNCNGNEENIRQCYRSDGFCPTSANLGVTCSNGHPDFPLSSLHCNAYVRNGDLRLVDGPDIFHGRAEVYISEVKDWATFCAEDWNYKLAKVVCRELNYRPATWTGKSRYGEGIGPISNCPTYEDWLFFPESCSVLYISPPTTTCDHSMDIGVHCDGLEQGEEQQVRLVNGTERTEGRVEIFDKGLWKTMCADDLGLEVAQAMCRQLGMPPPTTTLPGGSFGGNDALEKFWDIYNCTEHQQSLEDCNRSLRSTPCLVENAAIQCSSWIDAKKGDSRLTGGPTKAYGQLQIFHDGQWGVVCRRDGWDQSSAQVMCRELGYAGVLHQLAWHTKNDPELPVWESSINCLGNESRLEDCVVVLGEGGSCGNRFALAVCDTPPKSDSYDVRLTGGPYPNQGQVEVLYGGVWGTICIIDWDLTDSDIVCRQLGFKSAAFALIRGLYDNGQHEVLFQKIDCRGWEDNLIDCRYQRTEYEYFPCYSNWNAGVVCNSDQYPSKDPRLTQDPTTDPPVDTAQTLRIVWIVLLVLSVLCSVLGGCFACDKHNRNRNAGNQNTVPVVNSSENHHTNEEKVDANNEADQSSL